MWRECGTSTSSPGLKKEEGVTLQFHVHLVSGSQPPSCPQQMLQASRNLRCLEKQKATGGKDELIHIGAKRPRGTLFPWRGLGSSGGDDFRAGGSPLATPGNGHWLVAHSSHAPPPPW